MLGVPFIIVADVVKLVYTLDLGSSASRREGSSPFIRTIILKAGIAQLARASAFQADCREFESRFPLHLKSHK